MSSFKYLSKKNYEKNLNTYKIDIVGHAWVRPRIFRQSTYTSICFIYKVLSLYRKWEKVHEQILKN